MVNKRNCGIGFILGLILVILVFFIIANNYNSSSYDSYDDDTYVFNSFNKDDCKEINFKELDKNPDKYTGDNLKLRGKVMQITEGRKTNYLLMYVGGDYSQLAYVEYYNDTNIIEDDWITVYGVCAGS